MIWFTSDHHFDHEKIINYCNRPFENTKEMNKRLTIYYNNIIDNNDVVYFLGDFVWNAEEKSVYVKRLLKKLKGKKHLILGNHDKMNPFQYIECGFCSVHTNLSFEYEENTFYLYHDPSNATMFKDNIFLHGHVHDLFKQVRNAINVGVDVWNYQPVSIKQIVELCNEQSH